jgi:ribosome-associated protein
MPPGHRLFAPSGLEHDGSMREVSVTGDRIRLGQFLKLANLVEAGSDVRDLLVSGTVRVNGEVETRRGRQLLPGDVLDVDGVQLRVSHA